MESIRELRRVLEIHLNYMENTFPLDAVRSEITRCKKQLGILTPAAIWLASLTSLAALLTVIGAEWIPWEYMGGLVILSFCTILPTVRVYQKMELMKKRELFLLLLHKINQPSIN